MKKDVAAAYRRAILLPLTPIPNIAFCKEILASRAYMLATGQNGAYGS